MDLEQTAIERLRFAAEMSLRAYKQPLVITYSGGKDSDVLLHLAGKAGIQYEVLHSLTTADAPETVWHVRDTFRRLELAGVKCDIDTHRTPDGGNVTMWNLIPRKLMPPTRLVRYCCAALKETSGRGRWIATGVRWAESQKRKSRGVMEALHRDKSKRLTLMNDNDESRMLIENCQLKGTRTVNPIIDWPTEAIWDYCAAEKICINPLYACGEDRVGCINCPMAGKHRKVQLARYPGYRDAYIRAYGRMIEERRSRGLPCDWQTGEDVLHWSLEDGVLPGQMVLEGMEEDTL
jgi:phosphoadenosine phosphosulfate reductase|nr:MAG TPA: phosphoadenosine-phosphosulfate reductase [Caudoviricetes sp.]